MDPPSIAGIPIPSTVFRDCDPLAEADLSYRADCSELILDAPVCLVTRGGACIEVDDDLRKNGNEVVVPRLPADPEPFASGARYPFSSTTVADEDIGALVVFADSLVPELRWLNPGGINASPSGPETTELSYPTGGLIGPSDVPNETPDASPGLTASGLFLFPEDETRFSADENDHFLLIVRGLCAPTGWESADVTDNAGDFKISVISESEKTSPDASAGDEVEFEIRRGGTSRVSDGSSRTGK